MSILSGLIKETLLPDVYPVRQAFPDSFGQDLQFRGGTRRCISRSEIVCHDWHELFIVPRFQINS